MDKRREAVTTPNDLAATPSQEQRPSVGYVLLRTIGEGSFAKVKLARHVQTGIEVAVKVIHQLGSSRPSREMEAMKKLDHPNIVQLFEVIETPDTLFLVMELVGGGNLADHLKAHGDMPRREVRSVWRQLVSAVHYCHAKGIVHRDLKPQNILLDTDRHVRLADFGLCNEHVGRQLNSFCGTLRYVAPEIILKQSYHGPGVDVWSLGVVLFRMACGKLPFVGDNSQDLASKIVGGQYTLPKFVSTDLADLLGKCLTLNPRHRATTEHLMAHRWTNVGRAPLRPYRESPCESLNSKVIQQMNTLGYQREEIEAAVRDNRFDKIMGTYLILCHKSPHGKGCTIYVRPARKPGTSPASSESLSDEPSGSEAKGPGSPPGSRDLSSPIPAPTSDLETSSSSYPKSEPSSPEPSLKAGSSSLASILEAESGAASPGPEHGSSSPGPQPEAEMTSPTPDVSMERSSSSVGLASGSPVPARESVTSSPSPQPDPSDTMSTGGNSGAPETETQVEGERPTPGSGQSQGRRGKVRRFLRLCQQLCCCWPSSKRKNNKVQPL